MLAKITNVRDYSSEPLSVFGTDDVSLTIPGQAIDLRTVVTKLANGESVPTIAMMYDKDPSFDDVDLSDIDPRHVTPNMLKVNFGIGADPANPANPADPVDPADPVVN